MRYLFFIFFLTFILNGCKEFNPEKISCKDNYDCPLKYMCGNERICIPGCELRKDELKCEENNAHCVFAESEFNCVCNAKYIEDINGTCIPGCELIKDVLNCEEKNAHCVESNGVVECKCNDGYEKDEFDSEILNKNI